MIEPYYQDESCTLYLGDCREILPTLEAAGIDLTVTDPPYPKLKGGMKSNMGGGVSARNANHETVALPWGDDLTPLKTAWDLCSGAMFVFCSFHSVDMVPSILSAEPIGLVTWYKRNSMPPVRSVPHYQTEFVWAFSKPNSGLDWKKLKTMYDIPMLQGGCMADERILNDDGSTLHPAQKPIYLMQQLLKIGGKLICDPYAGTGTTLVAAKREGRKSIGIEIHEPYAEIAANRLRQGILDFTTT